ncbi:hypothetical protein KKA02_00800 [Patescibacteria group bacterium]|nr:hypothetical protein [Patescibacteria group bacterium]
MKKRALVLVDILLMEIKINKKRAFTLIEMVVIMGSTGLIFVIIAGILMNSVKSSRRISVANSVEESGAWAIAEIRKNLLKADIESLTCPADVGSSLSFVNRLDGATNYIVCDETGGSIASVSAIAEVNFLGNSVLVSNCQDFVSCDLTSFFPVVDFKFTLSSGDEESGVDSYVERDFDATVVVRE